MSELSPRELTRRQQRTMDRLVRPAPFEVGFPETPAVSGGGSGTRLRQAQVLFAKRISTDPPRWLYWIVEVEVDADTFEATLKSGGFDSGGVLLAQPATDEDGPIVSAPTPGIVLLANEDGEIVFTWGAVASATNYRISLGSTLGGSEHFTTTTTGTSLAIDAAELPGDGSIVYVRVESFIDPDWTPNDFLFYDAATTLHLARNRMECNSVSEAVADFPSRQCDDSDKTKLPSDAILVPIGGYPPADWTPAGEPATDWTSRQNPPIVDFQMIGGVPWIVGRPIGHWSACAGAVTPDAEDVTLARLTSPAPGATLGSTTVTFNLAGVTGALEYWLMVGDEIGSGEYFDGSLGTGTSQEVTGLPDEGETIFVRVGVKLPGTRVFWFKNDYKLTAHTA